MVLMCCCRFAYSQGNTTNSGTEFWTAYMDHISPPGSGRGSQMSLYITSAVNTTGIVAVADGSFSKSFSVVANQVTTVNIPASAFIGAQGFYNKGIHITSLKPIAVYGHIYAASVSGATLLLPVPTLGKDYYSINYTQESNSADPNPGGGGGDILPSYSTFMVIGTEPNTKVEITPSVDLLDGKKAGQTFTISLTRGQVYQGLAKDDLTGTHIQSVSSSSGTCTKIAVFSGSSKILIGRPNRTSDNLFQQVYPTASWGKNYITAPLANRSYDVIRIVVSDPDTKITINGQLISTPRFDDALFYEFYTSTPNSISADKPIQVVQYAVTQGNSLNNVAQPNDRGDPEMIYLNPLEQTLDHVTLYSTSNFQIENNYINVVIKKTAVPTFVLDGQPYTAFADVPGNFGYSYAQIPVSSGTHNISAADGFNAIAYGFGVYESYGYAAGTNLKNLNEFIALSDPQNNSVSQTNGCAGVTYKLQLTLPFQTSDIKWDFKDGSQPFHDVNPTVKSTLIKEGKTLYIYEYNKTVAFPAGDYVMVATVFNPIADACGSYEDIEFDFNIADPPAASFSYTLNCVGDRSVFTDKSDAKNNRIKTWLWDFGDGETSALQNPEHVYSVAGDYNVSLYVTNDNGCSGTAAAQKVHIAHLPVAAFDHSAINCVGKEIAFADRSTSADGVIKQWLWDYGDGQTETLIGSGNARHTYPEIGTYHVKLTVVLDGGCKSEEKTEDIVVHNLPVVDFSLPDVCLSDTYAQFNDKSTIGDNTEAEFTYAWDFGDGNANAANPNTSTQQNPKHKYTQAAVYQVTLTVTSKFGCVYTKTQSFTVNGDTPVASFKVENENNLCSANDVVFDDNSTVNFGNITKVVWYFDYNNHPENTMEFTRDNIPADRKFHYSYGVFNSPLTKTYLVRMDVYSGQTCVNSMQRPITIKANPLITISQVGPFCQSAAPVQIVVDKNGFNGSATFSGPGVSPSGLFNPSSSGPGTFTINCTFTEQNGCDYSTSEQIVVNADPTANAGPDLVLLEGGQVTIKATATGSNLTYQWTPSTALDHADVLNPVARPTSDINYRLIVTNSSGCTAASEIVVHVLKTPVIPNTFTPNGDGVNDTWEIKYLSTYQNNTVQVYNRYGERLYSSIGYSVPWDGNYRGASLPPGTYYYIIDPKNGRKIISGSVTIIR